jgi:hypothetical protein
MLKKLNKKKIQDFQLIFTWLILKDIDQVRLTISNNKTINCLNR